MLTPTFVDLQDFVIGRNSFVVKEFAALREGVILSHYIFESPEPWYFLSKADRQRVTWLMV